MIYTFCYISGPKLWAPPGTHEVEAKGAVGAEEEVELWNKTQLRNSIRCTAYCMLRTHCVENVSITILYTIIYNTCYLPYVWLYTVFILHVIYLFILCSKKGFYHNLCNTLYGCNICHIYKVHTVSWEVLYCFFSGCISLLWCVTCYISIWPVFEVAIDILFCFTPVGYVYVYVI